jgi:hypothetical protein
MLFNVVQIEMGAMDSNRLLGQVPQHKRKSASYRLLSTNSISFISRRIEFLDLDGNDFA